MKASKLQEHLVELRIMLQNICDGFNATDLNKKSTLTMRVKVLFVVSKNEKCTPTTLINTLAIAKSNLALLCKAMCDEGVLKQVKGGDDKRNVYYNITEKGSAELKDFYQLMESSNPNTLSVKELKIMERKFADIIEFLNKKYK